MRALYRQRAVGLVPGPAGGGAVADVYGLAVVAGGLHHVVVGPLDLPGDAVSHHHVLASDCGAHGPEPLRLYERGLAEIAQQHRGHVLSGCDGVDGLYSHLHPLEERGDPLYVRIVAHDSLRDLCVGGGHIVVYDVGLQRRFADVEEPDALQRLRLHVRGRKSAENHVRVFEVHGYERSVVDVEHRASGRGRYRCFRVDFHHKTPRVCPRVHVDEGHGERRGVRPRDPPEDSGIKAEFPRTGHLSI